MSTLTLADQTERLQTIVDDFAGRVKDLWAFSQAQPQLSLAALESKARQLARDCFAAPLQCAIEQQRGQVEDVARLDSHPCACGAAWRNKGTPARTIITFLGELRVERTYYYCERCRHGYYPLDAALAWGPEHFSDDVPQAVSLLGAELAFAPAAATLLSVSGVNVSVREVERLTETRGAQLEQARQHEQQPVAAGGPPPRRCSRAGSRPRRRRPGRRARGRWCWMPPKPSWWTAGLRSRRAWSAAPCPGP